MLASAWALIAGVSERRRTAAALTVVADGGSPAAALAAAGLPCWAVWLRFQPQLFEYQALPGAAIGGEELRELCTRALRPGVRGCSGRLASGTWIEITDGDDPLRLAVGSERPLSRLESQLVRDGRRSRAGCGRGAATAGAAAARGRPAPHAAGRGSRR